MQLTLDTGDTANTIRSYEPGKILIQQQTITTNVMVAANSITIDWQPQQFSELTLAHLEPIFGLQPEIVLIGTGEQQQFTSPAILSAFYTRHIGIEIMNTAAACRTYNVLIAEDRKVVAVLFLR